MITTQLTLVCSVVFERAHSAVAGLFLIQPLDLFDDHGNALLKSVQDVLTWIRIPEINVDKVLVY